MKKTLNGIDFHTYIAYGANEVIKNKEELNRINVFPVADGDTGNNLAMTLRSMVEYAKVEESFHLTAKSVSEAGILGARGNSGVLFAQFISGFANALKGKDGVSVSEFINAAEESAGKLYQVLSNPVEGTIITVIREWVRSMSKHSNSVEGFEDLFIESMPGAEAALVETTSQMELLRINRVVDSGAKGFILFLRGIALYIQGKAESISIGTLWNGSLDTMEREGHHEGAISYRYCYECILRDSSASLQQIKSQLKAHGDSLIVAGEGDVRHVHIHTDHPAKVTGILNREGKVTRPKVEDMVVQSDLFSVEKIDRRIAIVTDSIADITPELKDKYKIHVIPLSIQVGERQYIDRLTVDAEEFYGILDTSVDYPTSSLPSEPLIRERLEWLLTHYEEILVITVAGALSGTYDAFRRQVAGLGQEGHRVKVIDSRLNSGAQGLLVLEAARLVESGMTSDEIRQKLEDSIDKTHIFVALGSFKHARRSGRIPEVVGRIGTLFNLKPIVSLDKNGKGTAFSVGFSQQKLIRKIYQMIETAMKESGIQSFSVVHGGDSDSAGVVALEVERLTGLKPEFISEISSITALHAGPGAIAVSFMKK